jgi:putative transposase
LRIGDRTVFDQLGRRIGALRCVDMSVQPLQFLLLVFAGWVNRRQLEVIDYLKEENRVLREQLHGRRLRFTDEQRRRLAVRGKALGRRVLRDVTSLLTPDTILRWYRQLIAAKYDGTAERGAGRPRTAVPVQDLVVKFATENPGWGYTRLRGALGNLGHVIDRNTIKRILNEHGLQPAPERRKRMPWKTFIKAHLGAIAAMDFFTVEVLTLAGPAAAWSLDEAGRAQSHGRSRWVPQRHALCDP